MFLGYSENLVTVCNLAISIIDKNFSLFGLGFFELRGQSYNKKFC